MALMDEIAGGYKPAQILDQSTSSGGQVFNQGMNIGVNMADNIAKMKLNYDIQSADIEIKKQDLQNKMDDREFDYLKLATNKDLSPSARGAIANSWKSYAENVRGRPINEDTLKLLLKDDGIADSISGFMAQGRGYNPGTPEYSAYKENLGKVLNSLGGGPVEMVETANKLQQFPDQVKKIQELTKQKITTDTLTQKRQKGFTIDDIPVLTQGYIDAGFDPVSAATYAKDQVKNSQLNAVGGTSANNPRIAAAKTAIAAGTAKGIAPTVEETRALLDPSTDPDVQAQVLSSYQEKVAKVTGAVTSAGIAANQGRAKYFNQVIPLKYAELKNHTDSLTLQKLKEVDNAPDVVMASKNAVLAGDAYQIVNNFNKTGTLRRQDLALLNKEISRQLTGASRSNMGEQEALDMKSAQLDITKAMSYFSGDNLTSVGQGIAQDAIGRFQRVIDGLNEGRKRAYSAHVNSEVSQGLITSPDAQKMLYNDAGHFGYSPVVIDPSVPQQSFMKSGKIKGGFPGVNSPASPSMITMPSGKKYTPDQVRQLLPQMNPAAAQKWKQYLDNLGTQ